MYLLKLETQIQILQLLVEGNSISSISRFLGVHRDTCTRLLVRFAKACQRFHDAELRDLQLRHIEIDELETYVRKKQMTVAKTGEPIDGVGEYWVFIALDQDTRLVASYQVDKREQLSTHRFFANLASRIKMPFPSPANFYKFRQSGQKPILTISTDGSYTYVGAIKAAFGPFAAYGSINKSKMLREGKATPQHFKDLPKSDYISTSLVERNNLTLRTFIRRIFRKTLCYSKKVSNLHAAVALHVVHYNYCWRHKTLKTTPAMAAGLINKQWTMSDLYNHLRQRWPQDFLDVDKKVG